MHLSWHKITMIAGLVLLAIIGLWLRVRDIDRSLVNDELWTVFFSSTRHLKSYRDMLAFISWMPTVNPPLHPLLMRPWIALFGDGELSLRIPSVIFGLVAIPVFYRLVQRLFPRKVAMVASVLLIFAYPHVYFSSIARNYSLFFLLSLLSMDSLFEGLRQWHFRPILLYIVWTVLLLYCHYFALFFLLAQMIYVIYKKGGLGRWLLVWGAVGLLYLPGVPDMLHNAKALYFGSWVPRVGILYGINQQLTFSGITGWGWLTIFPVTLLGIGIWGLWKDHQKHAMLLVLWFMIPVVVPLIISQFTQPFFVTRFAFITLSPLLIILSLGLCKAFYKKPHLAVAVAVFALFSSLPAPQAPYPLEHEDWKRAVKIVTRPALRDATVVLYPVSTATRMALEYYGNGSLLRRALASAKDNRCQPVLFVLSRYEDYRLKSSCGYALKKRHMDMAPYVFEYGLNTN